MDESEGHVCDAIRQVCSVVDSADLALWLCVRAALDRGVDPHAVADAAGVGRATMYRRLKDRGLAARRGPRSQS